MTANPKKRASNGNTNGRPGGRGKRRRFEKKLVKEGSNEEVLLFEIRDLLATRYGILNYPPSPRERPPLSERQSEIEVIIHTLSSTGDGLGYQAGNIDHVYVVPFSIPGDTVKAKVVRHFPDEHYTLTDFITVLKSTPVSKRDDSLIKCPYFTTCSGCQFQMLPYIAQLTHKKTVIDNAYERFSGISPRDRPPVGMTIGSPLQYGYRTKLTPHFDAPPGARSAGRRGERKVWEERPPIGFMRKGTRQTLDIEDCPIGTDAVRQGMKSERDRVGRELEKYKKGATLILRESTTRIPKAPASKSSPPPDAIIQEHDDYTDYKTCVTDPNGTSTEYVDDYVFTNPASAFFQNNNSILSKFTEYIRKQITGPLPPTPIEVSTSPYIGDKMPSPKPKITHLIDAYSGSGLFTITLSSLFNTSVGIDIAASSIASALKNLELNHLSQSGPSLSPPSGDDQNAGAKEEEEEVEEEPTDPSSTSKKVSFIAADAAQLFASVTTPPAETAVILDPPRKGCDTSFLEQLMAYGAERVIYVSCNVHTQARDVGVLVAKGGYEIESLVGFDFFPQTSHVEGVAVLRIRGESRVLSGDKAQGKESEKKEVGREGETKETDKEDGEGQ